MELKHNSLTDRCSYNKIGLSFNIITNALLYKGSTSDFGSECRGSNPLGATILWDNHGVAKPSVKC